MTNLRAVPTAAPGPFARSTPGPWRVARNGSMWVYGPPGAGPMSPGESPAVAVTFFPQDRDLIAAAPDLLAIVRYLVDVDETPDALDAVWDRVQHADDDLTPAQSTLLRSLLPEVPQ